MLSKEEISKAKDELLGLTLIKSDNMSSSQSAQIASDRINNLIELYKRFNPDRNIDVIRLEFYNFYRMGYIGGRVYVNDEDFYDIVGDTYNDYNYMDYTIDDVVHLMIGKIVRDNPSDYSSILFVDDLPLTFKNTLKKLNDSGINVYYNNSVKNKGSEKTTNIQVLINNKNLFIEDLKDILMVNINADGSR